MKVHKKLQNYRKRKGYTLTALAKKIGITPQHLGYIEKGKKTLSYSLAFRISYALDVKPDELFLEDYQK